MIIIGDIVFAPINEYGHLPHPAFPLSILASLSAGIGEEILFRGFVYGLYGLLFNWVLRRFNGREAALWIANIIAALAFGAGHLGTIMALTNAASLAAWNPILVAEIFLLNGIVSLMQISRIKVSPNIVEIKWYLSRHMRSIDQRENTLRTSAAAYLGHRKNDRCRAGDMAEEDHPCSSANTLPELLDKVIPARKRDRNWLLNISKTMFLREKTPRPVTGAILVICRKHFILEP